MVAQGEAERPQLRSGTLGTQKNQAQPRRGGGKPGWMAEILLTFRRPSRADAASWRITQGFATLRRTLGYDPPPPPGG